MRTRWTRAELQGYQVAWLLDLTFAGQVIRVSDRALVVTSSDLGDLTYAGTLGRTIFSESLSLFSDSPQVPRATIEAHLPVDVPTLILQGHRLGSATGELSQVRLDQRGAVVDAWEDRCVKLRGRAREPVHGRKTDPVRFTLQADLWTDTAVIPSPNAVVSTADFPSQRYSDDEPTWLSDEDIGVQYPIIIGCPGRDAQVFRGWVNGSQAVWANKGRNLHALVVAGHHVEATDVWVSCDDNPVGIKLKVYNGADGNGNPVAYISDSDPASSTTSRYDILHNGLEDNGVPSLYRISSRDPLDVYVGWYDGGGAIGRNGTLVRGAGDVIQYLLERTSVQVDHGGVAAAAPYLNRFRIDACIEAATSPLEWVQDHLLPILPVSMHVGPSGLYPIAWDPDAEPLATLDADEDTRIQIGPDITVDNSRIRNDFTLRYGLELKNGGDLLHVARLGATYEASTAYAKGKLRQYSDDPQEIEIRARTAGPAGKVRVTFTETGTLGVTDTVATNTCAITYNNGTDTVDAIRDRINDNVLGSLLLIRADSDSTAVMVGAGLTHDQDITLVLEDNGRAADLYCAASQSRYVNEDGTGVFPESLESEVVYERATADAILRWRARAFALEHTTTTALAPIGEWGWVQLGATIFVTATAYGLSALPFVVEEREEANDGMIGFRLRHIPDPVRDARS